MHRLGNLTPAKRTCVQGAIVLEEPFRGVGLFDAALFLRLAYQSHDLRPEFLDTVHARLPALLRLAHRLDAPLILEAVCERMIGGLLGLPVARKGEP